MAFDPVAYSEMLDESFGYGRRPQRGGSIRPLPMPEDEMYPPNLRDGGEGPVIDQPGQSLQQRPMSSIDGGGADPMPIGTRPPMQTQAPSGTGIQQIQATPPFKVKFKEGAAEKVKTPGDLVNAMTPSSQRKYMDWWEQQHGAINERYAQLQQELGRRPDADGNLSRKEQFRMLMEFGIELMARSGRGEQGAGGVAFANAMGNAQGRQEAKVAEYDARAGMIDKARREDLKGIGSYGDAMKGQSAMDQDAAQIEEARARTKAVNRRKPEIISADQGTFDYDPETQKTTPITGIDGKPLTNLQVGRRGGSAAGRDSRTANQKNIDDLVDRGVPEQLALDIVYRRIRDPQKAWADIYRDRRRQYASEAEAKQEADDIMARFYGDDWESKPTNARIDKDDPLGLR